MTVTHASFTLERDFPVAPAKVFAAYSDAAARQQWFAGGAADYQQDFRVGGVERLSVPSDTGLLGVVSTYHDIVDQERILYSTLLRTDDRLSTVSETSIELVPTAAGTHLVITEHGMFLPGQEQPEWRQQGTSDQLDALDRLLS
jgi:uncharacterized protein YndB with AHSA1/START domain